MTLVNPLVSVGVPVFNSIDNIERVLNCIENQTYQNLEIVISDNASTDGTSEICQKFSKADKRCTYFRFDKNVGAPKNFNTTYLNSKGEFFLWLASDDEINASFIESGVRYLIHNPEVILSAPETKMVLRSSETLVCSYTESSLGIGTKGFRRFSESYKNLPMIWMYGLFRSEALSKTSLLKPIIASDVAFMQEVALLGSIETNTGQQLKYYMRDTWNSSEEDRRAFGGDDRIKWTRSPGLGLLFERIRRITNLSINPFRKFLFFFLLFSLEARRVAFKYFLLIGKFFLKTPQKRKLVIWGYWKSYDPGGVVVHNEKIFRDRVIFPKFDL
ncbi:MAG: glycosyltransferase family 2 protein [Acidimicrobiales bacterium]|nr:glycosyltransferase family 2 protein [Acidimicrobiales bacterium]